MRGLVPRWCLFAAAAVTFSLWSASATNTNHWSFQPLRRPPIPQARQTNPIDALVCAALAKKSLSPGPEANRRTLIRRLSFDLRGLPPSPEETAAFLKDQRRDAFAHLVERFLDSPQYGERWGRHWLDIAAYADSNGYFNADSDRPLAWKFRDYVVRSIQADKPLDRFIQEQLAGDELAGYTAGGDVTPDMVEPLVATHFLRNVPDGTGESDGNPLEVKVDQYAVLEGNVQLLGSAFMGLTFQCARCHDHKFEPVTQADYYALQAILRPAFDPDHWLKPKERVVEIGLRSEREAYQKLITQVDRDVKTLKESLEGLTAPFRKQLLEENLGSVEAALRKEIEKALDTKEKDRSETMKALLKTNATLVEVGPEALEKKFPAFAAASAPINKAIEQRNREKPTPLDRIAATFEPANAMPAHHLLVRGNHAREGKEIPPAIPAVFRITAADDARPGFTSPRRRLELARWLTSSNNPVVARVLANRVWHYHTGEGLVSTLDNLGQSGAAPASHELLDWLATELIQSGWSLKHLHRLILNSATWKQACVDRPMESPLLRCQPRRLDAESLRDAMLAVSGELDLTQGGSYVPTATDKQGQVIIDEKQSGSCRRSLYLQQRRTAPVSFISMFDGPAHNPVCIQRVSSTVALQSLAVLNSDFARCRARGFAKRVLTHAEIPAAKLNQELLKDGRLKTALSYAFQLACNRPPTRSERSAAKAFIKEQSVVYEAERDGVTRVWTDLCQMLLASNAFLYVD